MEKSLTQEVLELAKVVTSHLKEKPGEVTAEMLIALRGCAEILEHRINPLGK